MMDAGLYFWLGIACPRCFRTWFRADWSVRDQSRAAWLDALFSEMPDERRSFALRRGDPPATTR
jgi:hypothetical protein